jgi:hypothetical protein
MIVLKIIFLGQDEVNLLNVSLSLLASKKSAYTTFKCLCIKKSFHAFLSFFFTAFQLFVFICVMYLVNISLHILTLLCIFCVIVYFSLTQLLFTWYFKSILPYLKVYFTYILPYIVFLLKIYSTLLLKLSQSVFCWHQQKNYFGQHLSLTGLCSHFCLGKKSTDLP